MINWKLLIDRNDAKPIWQQIEEGVKRLVTLGVLPPGSLIASVQELAKELRVNPTIVAKAYQRLIETGVLADRRWEGTFVAEPPLDVTAYERKRLLYEEALRYATLVSRLGASSEEASWELMAALRTVFLRRGAVRFGVKMSQYGRKQMGGRR